MAYDDGSSGGFGQGFGLTHLSSMPVTMTYGLLLLGVLVLLVLLKILFAGASANVSAGGGVR